MYGDIRRRGRGARCPKDPSNFVVFSRYVESLSLSSRSNRRTSRIPKPPVWVGAVWLQLGVSVGDDDLPDARPRDHAVSVRQTTHRAQARTTWPQEIASQPLQQALVHLDKAFTRLFREKKGYPRFHCKPRAECHVSPRRQNLLEERRHLLAQGRMDAHRLRLPLFGHRENRYRQSRALREVLCLGTR